MIRSEFLRSKLPKLNIPQSPSHQPTTFTFFSKLPLEVKNKIWAYAATVPREILLLEATTYRNLKRFSPPNPAVLETNRESRKEAKRHYKGCSDFTWMPARRSEQEIKLDPTIWIMVRKPWKRVIWVNFEVDRFVFGREPYCLLNVPATKFNFGKEVIGRIRHLILDGLGKGEIWKVVDELSQVLRKPKFERVTIVLGKYVLEQNESELMFKVECMEREVEYLDLIAEHQRMNG